MSSFDGPIRIDVRSESTTTANTINLHNWGGNTADVRAYVIAFY